jgi:hypothetical protein
MSSKREIKEGLQEQGTEEEITYTLTVPSTWGTPTGTPTVKGYSSIDNVYTDVTSVIFPSGSASIASQVITLPKCKALTADTLYRIEIKFDCTNGDVKEAYAWIQCRR